MRLLRLPLCAGCLAGILWLASVRDPPAYGVALLAPLLVALGVRWRPGASLAWIPAVGALAWTRWSPMPSVAATFGIALLGAGLVLTMHSPPPGAPTLAGVRGALTAGGVACAAALLASLPMLLRQENPRLLDPATPVAAALRLLALAIVLGFAAALLPTRKPEATAVPA